MIASPVCTPMRTRTGSGKRSSSIARLRPRRSKDRRGRAREDEHAAVAFTVDEPPAVGSARVTKDLCLPLEQVGIALAAEPPQQGCRTFDVSEQEGMAALRPHAQSSLFAPR
jgi:hypothetical protein